MSGSTTREIFHGEEDEDYLGDSTTNIEDEKEREVERDTKTKDTEPQSGCITLQHLDEMMLKLEALQTNMASEMEDIGTNLVVVKTQCREELESCLSIVSRTGEGGEGR